ncbi:O-antigen ligase family protein [Frankia sp. CN7]|uniref:O-antigen ligase family protein n=2 Tax=Frankia nepalensis TaxID=1836974 RepID=A0A937RBF5_9ACTN|nr:O-antigen ligase family protein [Frankia nepalensis]MBL7502673.1 O-antigen ligase family protein [Frankia nepalensis]MBL7629058.1 O-antigen ligase family protein [Frankia nepalensis]
MQPVFLTDVLVAAGAGHCAAVRLTGRGRRPARGFGLGEVAVGLFALYAMAQFVLGGDHSLLALRDFAPYGYAWVGLLSGWALRASGPAQRAATARLLVIALYVHLVWVVVATAVPGLTTWLPMLPGGRARLLELRPDFDAAMLGVTASLSLVRFMRGDGRFAGLIAILCLGLAAGMPSRAGLLAACICCVLTLVLTGAAARRQGVVSDRRLLVFAVALCGAALLPMTRAGSKLFASFGLVETSSELGAVGVATMSAREKAWQAVIQYVADTHTRVFGSGYGINFVAESGAYIYLSGVSLVRSPHNYLIGLYARLGLVGVVLFLLVVAAAVRAVVRARSAIGSDDLLLIATIVPAAILTTAMMGVVLESPFGAVPFFWCLGILLAAGWDRPGYETDRPETVSAVAGSTVAVPATTSTVAVPATTSTVAVPATTTLLPTF